MALTVRKQGIYHETWVETAWHDGGATQTIDTNIPIKNAAELNSAFKILEKTDVIGTPNFDSTVSNNNGYLRIAIENTAAAGNMANYVFRVWLEHSVQCNPGAGEIGMLVCDGQGAGDVAALSDTWFVDGTRGHDTLGDGSLNRPLATIGAAYTAATAGDYIYVAPGEYAEELTLAKDITIAEIVPGSVKISHDDDASGPITATGGTIYIEVDELENANNNAGAFVIDLATSGADLTFTLKGATVTAGGSSTACLDLADDAAQVTIVNFDSCSFVLGDLNMSGLVDPTTYVIFDRCESTDSEVGFDVDSGVAARVTMIDCLFNQSNVTWGGADDASILDIGSSVIATLTLAATGTITGHVNLATGSQVGSVVASQNNQPVHEWLGGERWEFCLYHVDANSVAVNDIYTVPASYNFSPSEVRVINRYQATGGALNYKVDGSGAGTVVAAVGAGAVALGVVNETVIQDNLTAGNTLEFDVTAASTQADDYLDVHVVGNLWD